MTELRDTRLEPSPCPNCGKKLDSALDTEGDSAPSPGDITICFGCHHLMAFADDMTFRELTPDEMIEVAGEPAILRAMEALDSFKKWEERHRR
jgi:hypothetical protein